MPTNKLFITCPGPEFFPIGEVFETSNNAVGEAVLIPMLPPTSKTFVKLPALGQVVRHEPAIQTVFEFKEPFTSNVYDGLVVPIPTLPVASMRIPRAEFDHCPMV